jgi:hypothetical protein
MDRKQVKKHLKSCCRGVLEEYLTEVGFTDEETILFKNRYLIYPPKSIVRICMMIPCGTSKYNDLHNNILDKLISYFQHIN